MLMRLLPVILAAIPLVGAFAASPSLQLEAGIRGFAVDSAVQQARAAGITAELDWRTPLASILEAHLQGGALVESGTHRARFDNDFAPRQGLRMREAALRLSLGEIGFLTAGTLDQNRWRARTLLNDQSFPALHQEVRLETHGWKFGFEAQQAFVTDASLVQPWGEWQSDPAQFFIERVKVGWKDADRVELSTHVSHFRFSGLSPSLADRSRSFGNRIDGIGPVISRFTTQFQGLEFGGDAKLRVGNWSPYAEVSAQINSQAPTSGRAFRAESGVGVAFRQFELSPYFEWFSIEENAAPAVFNDRTLGHNNRRGIGAGARLFFPENKIEVALRWTRAPRIVPRVEQSDLSYVGATIVLRDDLL